MIEQLYEDQFLETTPLFDAMFHLSAAFITKQGNFLPHGGYLDRSGQIALCAAAPENETTNSTEVLPLLHDGLREQTSDWSTLAVVVSESVFLGENKTPAIKVLVEHRDGMTLALYIRPGGNGFCVVQCLVRCSPVTPLRKLETGRNRTSWLN